MHNENINIHVISISVGEEKEKGAKAISEKMIIKKFQKLIKYCKLLI